MVKLNIIKRKTNNVKNILERLDIESNLYQYQKEYTLEGKVKGIDETPKFVYSNNERECMHRALDEMLDAMVLILQELESKDSDENSDSDEDERRIRIRKRQRKAVDEKNNQTFIHEDFVGKAEIGILFNPYKRDDIRSLMQNKWMDSLEKLHIRLDNARKLKIVEQKNDTDKEINLLVQTLNNELMSERSMAQALRDYVQQIQSDLKKQMTLNSLLSQELQNQNDNFEEKLQKYNLEFQQLRRDYLARENIADYDPDMYSLFVFPSFNENKRKEYEEQKQVRMDTAVKQIRSEYETKWKMIEKDHAKAIDSLKQRFLFLEEFDPVQEQKIQNLKSKIHNVEGFDAPKPSSVAVLSIYQFKKQQKLIKQLRKELYTQFNEKEVLQQENDKLYQKRQEAEQRENMAHEQISLKIAEIESLKQSQLDLEEAMKQKLHQIKTKNEMFQNQIAHLKKDMQERDFQREKDLELIEALKSNIDPSLVQKPKATLSAETQTPLSRQFKTICLDDLWTQETQTSVEDFDEKFEKTEQQYVLNSEPMILSPRSQKKIEREREEQHRKDIKKALSDYIKQKRESMTSVGSQTSILLMKEYIRDNKEKFRHLFNSLFSGDLRKKMQAEFDTKLAKAIQKERDAFKKHRKSLLQNMDMSATRLVNDLIQKDKLNTMHIENNEKTIQELKEEKESHLKMEDYLSESNTDPINKGNKSVSQMKVIQLIDKNDQKKKKPDTEDIDQLLYEQKSRTRENEIHDVYRKKIQTLQDNLKATKSKLREVTSLTRHQVKREMEQIFHQKILKKEKDHQSIIDALEHERNFLQNQHDRLDFKSIRILRDTLNQCQHLDDKLNKLATEKSSSSSNFEYQPQEIQNRLAIQQELEDRWRRIVKICNVIMNDQPGDFKIKEITPTIPHAKTSKGLTGRHRIKKKKPHAITPENVIYKRRMKEKKRSKKKKAPEIQEFQLSDTSDSSSDVDNKEDDPERLRDALLQIDDDFNDKSDENVPEKSWDLDSLSKVQVMRSRPIDVTMTDKNSVNGKSESQDESHEIVLDANDETMSESNNVDCKEDSDIEYNFVAELDEHTRPPDTQHSIKKPESPTLTKRPQRSKSRSIKHRSIRMALETRKVRSATPYGKRQSFLLGPPAFKPSIQIDKRVRSASSTHRSKKAKKSASKRQNTEPEPKIVTLSASLHPPARDEEKIKPPKRSHSSMLRKTENEFQDEKDPKKPEKHPFFSLQHSDLLRLAKSIQNQDIQKKIEIESQKNFLYQQEAYKSLPYSKDKT